MVKEGYIEKMKVQGQFHSQKPSQFKIGVQNMDEGDYDPQVEQQEENGGDEGFYDNSEIGKKDEGDDLRNK